MTASPRNRYVVIPPRSAEQIAWNPLDPDDIPVKDCAYLGRAIASFEHQSPVAGLTFFITWDIERLPAYGSDVVAFALGDEWARMPAYAGRVRAIFKTYGTRYPARFGEWTRSVPYGALATLQDLRVTMLRLPSVVAALRRRDAPHVLDIPLGYYAQVDLPLVPVNERRYDAYFAGSTTNSQLTPRSFKYWLQSPKSLSRARMLGALRRLSVERPDLSIVTTLTGGFHQTTAGDAMTYSETMMQTKICVVPRGTSLETYRYFEGLRFGCVLVAERVPSRWFYDGAPVLTVDDWSELRERIPRLLADPDDLARRQEASLRWWSDVCGEHALGRAIATHVEGAPAAR